MRTLLASAPLVAGDVLITEQEAHHGRSVLRLRPGDEVRLVDGCGAWAVAVVQAVERHHIALHAANVAQGEDGPLSQLTLAVAPPKGSRFEDLVRAATELGVGTIRPLRCERSEREPNLDRAQRVAAEAVKQCRRFHLPQIGSALDFSNIPQQAERIIVADPSGGACMAGHPQPTIVVIGPEGGFTPAEQTQLRGWGELVRLADPILRIETAALAAAAVFATMWGSYAN